MRATGLGKRVCVSILVLAMVGFVGACVLAYQAVGWSGFDHVIAEPWGFVTLLDVFLGGLVMASVILFTEEKRWVACLWALGIFSLGHTVSALWLVQHIFRNRLPLAV